jgi:hypothetical protein
MNVGPKSTKVSLNLIALSTWTYSKSTLKILSAANYPNNGIALKKISNDLWTYKYGLLS